jgi:hypothetical protein
MVEVSDVIEDEEFSEEFNSLNTLGNQSSDMGSVERRPDRFKDMINKARCDRFLSVFLLFAGFSITHTSQQFMLFKEIVDVLASHGAATQRQDGRSQTPEPDALLSGGRRTLTLGLIIFIFGMIPGVYILIL